MGRREYATGAWAGGITFSDRRLIPCFGMSNSIRPKLSLVVCITTP
jgi:hypothetical protein